MSENTKETRELVNLLMNRYSDGGKSKENSAPTKQRSNGTGRRPMSSRMTRPGTAPGGRSAATPRPPWRPGGDPRSEASSKGGSHLPGYKGITDRQSTSSKTKRSAAYGSVAAEQKLSQFLNSFPSSHMAEMTDVVTSTPKKQNGGGKKVKIDFRSGSRSQPMQVDVSGSPSRSSRPSTAPTSRRLNTRRQTLSASALAGFTPLSAGGVGIIESAPKSGTAKTTVVRPRGWLPVGPDIHTQPRQRPMSARERAQATAPDSVRPDSPQRVRPHSASRVRIADSKIVSSFMRDTSPQRGARHARPSTAHPVMGSRSRSKSPIARLETSASDLPGREWPPKPSDAGQVSKTGDTTLRIHADVSFRLDSLDPNKKAGVRPLMHGRRTQRVYTEQIRDFIQRVFPSLAPAGRAETILLARWLDDVIDQIEDRYAESEDLSTRMTEIAVISSIVFQELVRQSTVHCAERGMLLVRLWNIMASLMEMQLPPDIDPEMHNSKMIELAEVTAERDELRASNIKRLNDLDRLRETMERREALQEEQMTALEAENNFLKDMLSRVDAYAHLIPQSDEKQWQKLAELAADAERASGVDISTWRTKGPDRAMWRASVDVLAEYFTHLRPKDVPPTLLANTRIKVGQDAFTQTMKTRAELLALGRGGQTSELDVFKSDFDDADIFAPPKEFVDVAVQTGELDKAKYSVKDILNQAKLRVMERTGKDKEARRRARDGVKGPSGNTDEDSGGSDDSMREDKFAIPEIEPPTEEDYDGLTMQPAPMQVPLLPECFKAYLSELAQGTGHALPPGHISRLIFEIYTDHLDQQQRSSEELPVFPLFVYQWFRREHSLRETAEGNLIDFFAACSNYMSSPTPSMRRMITFQNFVSNSDSEAYSSRSHQFFMSVFKAVFKSGRDENYQMMDNGVVFYNLDTLQSVSQGLKMKPRERKKKDMANFDLMSLGKGGAKSLKETMAHEKEMDAERKSHFDRVKQDFQDKLLRISEPTPADCVALFKQVGRKAPERVVDIDVYFDLICSLDLYLRRDLDQEIQALFSAADVDRDGMLNFQELQDVFRSDARQSESRLLKMFQEGARLSGQSGITLEVFMQLALRYGFAGWHPELDQQLEVKQRKMAANAEQFELLRDTWKAMEPAVNAQLKTMRGEVTMTKSKRGKQSRKAMMLGSTDAPRYDQVHIDRLQSKLTAFQTLLEEQADADAAWKSYRLLMAALKEKPEVTEDELMRILKRVRMFKECSPLFLQEIMKRLKQAKFEPGEYLIYEGEKGREMYLIKSGDVEILAGPKKDVVAHLHTGDFFGEVALVKNTVRNASIRTVTQCDLCVLFKEDFDEVLKQYPMNKDKLAAIAAAKTLSLKESTLCREKLKECPMFNDCNDAFIGKMVNKMKGMIFAAGKFLFRKNEIGRELYIVCDGSLEVIEKSQVDGTETVVSEFGPGDLFGENFLLRDDLTRSFACRTARISTVAVIYKDQLDQLMLQHPAQRNKIFQKRRKQRKRQGSTIRPRHVTRRESTLDMGDSFNDSFNDSTLGTSGGTWSLAEARREQATAQLDKSLPPSRPTSATSRPTSASSTRALSPQTPAADSVAGSESAGEGMDSSGGSRDRARSTGFTAGGQVGMKSPVAGGGRSRAKSTLGH